MKTIFIILIAVFGGWLFGYILIKIYIPISNYFLGLKVRKEILKKNLSPEELKRRNFYYVKKFYDIRAEVEHDLNMRTKFSQKLKNFFNFFNPFHKNTKGVSDYGRNDNNAGPIREQVSTGGEGNKSPGTGTGPGTEQPGTNTA